MKKERFLFDTLLVLLKKSSLFFFLSAPAFLCARVDLIIFVVVAIHFSMVFLQEMYVGKRMRAGGGDSSSFFFWSYLFYTFFLFFFFVPQSILIYIHQ